MYITIAVLAIAILMASVGALWSMPAAQKSPTLLIRGGRLIDGSGAPERRADVRVQGDTIVAIGDSLAPLPGERLIDAAGKVVAPGFIDTHSHADRGLNKAPGAATQVRQGITTTIVGQDGDSQMPISDFYESVLRIRPAINYATTIGHGTVRSLVLGGDFKRAATPAEVELMRALVDRGMRDGALGLSSGLEYDPGSFAEPSELIALGKVVARYGGYYSSHVRDEEHKVVEAWREAVDVGRQAKIPVIVSHIKLAVPPLWGKAGESLKVLEAARREGIQVTADWYPYTFWQSSIYVLIPERTFESREAWTAGLADVGGGKNIRVTEYLPNPAWNKKTIAEIAQLQGKDEVTTVIDMVREAGGGIGIIGTSMREDDLDTFAAHSLVNICSDGGLDIQHPRGAGAFPRVLGRFVRQRGVLKLPEAIAKMTGRSAAQVGLSDRGLLQTGKKADIVIFDPATVEDRSTIEQPTAPPVGIEYVIVNGEVVLDAGTLTQARPGRGLRRANWKP